MVQFYQCNECSYYHPQWETPGPSCSKGGYHYPVVSLTLICWMVIYPVDIALSNF